MSKYRILVVDDEEDLREILQFNLESEGYEVDTAESSEEALRILNDTHDLILLDVMMKGISGFKLAEKLRRELNITIPIIFLTAKDTENDMLTGFNIGGDDYISKPFSIKEVSARVKAVIKRTTVQEETHEEIIQIGEIVVDLLTKSVKIQGINIPITKKEFEILRILGKNPGRVYSREDILGKVWQDDSFVLERTVDVHITRLRKKLGEHGKYIINRSGYGYCIEL